MKQNSWFVKLSQLKKGQTSCHEKSEIVFQRVERDAVPTALELPPESC